MIHYLPVFIARYWIAVAVLIFALLSAYTSSPMYGQSAPPTPDVNTVPPIELIQTPTNTPFPTPTPIDDGDQSGGGGSLQPTSTPIPSDSDSDNSGNDSGDTGSGNAGSGDSGSGTGSSGNGNGQSGTGTGGNTGNEVSSESDDNGATDASEANGYTGTVNVVTLNVRRGPSLDDPIVDTVFINETVTILSRDSENGWWYVCCGSGSGREGWVSAQFITPNFAASEAETLLPISATTQGAMQSEAAADALVVEMRPSPAFAWQGQTVRLQYTVRNLSNETLTKLRLRNDLPPELAYVTTIAGQQGSVQTAGQEEDGIVYTINWPQIGAGEAVTATVTLQLANDLPNGAMVDNLAVVESSEGASALAGITFAMPPMRLPLFR